MEQVIQAAWTLAAAVIMALGGVGVQAVRAWTVNLVQQRLDGGAQRVAGQIAATVAGDDGVQTASREMLDAGVAAMRQRFPQTAGRLPDETLAGMIAGHLGLMGQGVAR